MFIKFIQIQYKQNYECVIMADGGPRCVKQEEGVLSFSNPSPATPKKVNK